MRTPARKDLPPIETHAIKEAAAPVIQKLIDPAIAFALPSKLRDAKNACTRPPSPFLIGVWARETKIDNQIPARIVSRAVSS